MYVSTCKGGATGQYTYVRLMESYRDENGKVKHKVVQNLGRLDILSQSDPNYLENLKKKYQEDYAEKMDFSHYFRWLFANFRECSLIS